MTFFCIIKIFNCMNLTSINIQNTKFYAIILDDADKLKDLAKKLKIKTKNSETTNNSPLPSKRPHKPKKSWSFEEDQNPPKKYKVRLTNHIN